MAKEIIISQEGYEDEITEYLFKLSPGQGLILDLGGVLPPDILTKHFYLKQETYLSPNIALEIDRVACRIAQNWHGGKAGLEYKGILVGDLIAYEAMQWLISAIKQSVIIERICREFNPKDIVLVDDGSSFSRIITLIAKSYNLSVRGLSPTLSNGVFWPMNRNILQGFADILKATYEWFHVTKNTFINLSGVLSPGFRRLSSLRSVLFDPYTGYELLIPQLFGCSCARIVIPRPNLRLMPQIRYYQKIFGVPTIYFRLLVTQTNEIKVSHLKKILGSQLNLSLPADFSGLEVVWEQLCRAFREYCGTLMQKACSTIDTAEKIIAKYEVGATVLPYDELGLYKALALVGKRDGLLTITYQHGVVNRYAALIPPTSEQVIVWDDDARARLRSWGVDDRRITVLPNPMTPLLRQKSQWLDKKAVRRKLRLEENQPIAFFAAQPFTGLSALDDPSQVNETLYRILDLACLIPEFYFIVKFHPNDAHRGKPERMRRFIEEQTLPNVRLLVSEDSHELILASDVVISGTSTCLWEATVLDRVAVAFVNQEYTRQLFPYNSNSGVIRTDNIKELMKILRDVARRKENPSMIASRAPIKPAYSNSKCSGYFDDPRWEVFSLIPPKAKTLLDIGCGAGWLGEKIKATRQCFIVGVEKDREAGKRANQILDAVFIQDIEKFPLPFRERSFDCIVISDLLEHLVDPWETLRRLVGLLSDDGVVIISIPNIGHYTTLLSLIAGHFEYKDEGILDRTHLRFFTHEGIKNLLERSGLGLIKMLRNTHAGRKMRVANLLLGNRLADLITFQYLIVAERGDKKIANRCIIHQCALS